MFLLLAAVEGLVVLVAFFYLIHLVSTIRNGQQVRAYWLLKVQLGELPDVSEDSFKRLSALGVINKQQAHALKELLGDK